MAKKKDKALGNHASLGIWFDTAEGVDYMLSKGFLVSQKFIGSVERRELKRKRCFRCQRFGHLRMVMQGNASMWTLRWPTRARTMPPGRKSPVP